MIELPGEHQERGCAVEDCEGVRGKREVERLGSVEGDGGGRDAPCRYMIGVFRVMKGRDREPGYWIGV